MARNETVKRRILEAAVALVDETGPGALRIQAVCESAGVSAPIVYRHFGSREGLVEAVQIERFSGSIQWQNEEYSRLAATCTTREQLRTFIEQTLRDVLTHRGPNRWMRLNVLGSAYARPELMHKLVEAQREAEGVLINATLLLQRRGFIPPEVDVPSLVEWQHDILLSRVFMENVSPTGNHQPWDDFTVKALLDAYFPDELH